MKTNLWIVGASGLGREYRAMIEHCPNLREQFQVVAYLDDDPASDAIDGIPVKRGVRAALAELDSGSAVVFAVGDSRVRSELVKMAGEFELQHPTLIHSSTQLHRSESIAMGRGTVLTAGSILTTDIELGEHVFVNLNCTIGHQCVLEDGVSLMPGVHLSGLVRVAKGAYIGTGAVVLNGLRIGEGAVVGAGAVVTRDVPDHTVVMGVPARPVRTV